MNPSVNRSSESPQSVDKYPQKPLEQTVHPPKPSSQPKSEASKQEEITSRTDARATIDEPMPADMARNQPIPPPSDAMQYRAIGLVRGQYIPSVEQFTQGTLLAADNTLVDAVLLGRVMSLVKKHLNLAESHLWVVYPRTRKEDNKLHVQIVGVWEPANLSQNPQTQEIYPSPDSSAVQSLSATDGYFSIRGEVIHQSWEENQIVVKIIQSPRKKEDKPKFFKLKLQNCLPHKMVGHFWDFQVNRQGDVLVIQDAKDIAILRVRKSKNPFPGKDQRGKKPLSPQRISDKPITKAPPKRREPIPKPIKRQSS
ncbi:MAG: hypothetical protein NVS2B14_03680 [Chamaesiphon sp.]